MDFPQKQHFRAGKIIRLLPNFARGRPTTRPSRDLGTGNNSFHGTGLSFAARIEANIDIQKNYLRLRSRRSWAGHAVLWRFRPRHLSVGLRYRRQWVYASSDGVASRRASVGVKRRVKPTVTFLGINYTTVVWRLTAGRDSFGCRLSDGCCPMFNRLFSLPKHSLV